LNTHAHLRPIVASFPALLLAFILAHSWPSLPYCYLRRIFDHCCQLLPTLASFWPSSPAYAANRCHLQQKKKKKKEKRKKEKDKKKKKLSFQTQVSRIFYIEFGGC
jgi:hypothetical protein